MRDNEGLENAYEEKINSVYVYLGKEIWGDIEIWDCFQVFDLRYRLIK